MILPPNGFRILLATRPVDFRKGMDRLVAHVANSFDLGEGPVQGIGGNAAQLDDFDRLVAIPCLGPCLFLGP